MKVSQKFRATGPRRLAPCGVAFFLTQFGQFGNRKSEQIVNFLVNKRSGRIAAANLFASIYGVAIAGPNRRAFLILAVITRENVGDHVEEGPGAVVEISELNRAGAK